MACNPVVPPRAPTSIIIGQQEHIPALTVPPDAVIWGETGAVTGSIIHTYLTEQVLVNVQDDSVLKLHVPVAVDTILTLYIVNLA